MKTRLVIFALLFLGLTTISAQNVELYKEIVTELSSSKYQGRGYAKNGVQKAQAYLQKQFLAAGVDVLTTQPYHININTFCGNMKMSVDGQKQVPGEDFVMREYSPGVKGTFPLYYIDTNNYDPNRVLADLKKPENKGCFVVCDFWFPYTHPGFSAMQSDSACPNTGMIYTWNEPLKFYKAYGNFVAEKPIIWATADFPKNAESITANIDNRFLKNYQSCNIITKIYGERHDSCYVFTAHYDHQGNMGKKLFFPGANDNASGTAAIITFAEYYKQHKPQFDIYFIALSGEETGLCGSTYFVEHPTFELSRIIYLFNLDMIGDNNPVQYVEVSKAGMPGFERMKALNLQNQYFKNLKLGELAENSDHYPFAVKGVPCILFENESGDAFPFYHTPKDDMQHFRFETYEPLFKLITDFIGR